MFSSPGTEAEKWTVGFVKMTETVLWPTTASVITAAP